MGCNKLVEIWYSAILSAKCFSVSTRTRNPTEHKATDPTPRHACKQCKTCWANLYSLGETEIKIMGFSNTPHTHDRMREGGHKLFLSLWTEIFKLPTQPTPELKHKVGWTKIHFGFRVWVRDTQMHRLWNSLATACYQLCTNIKRVLFNCTVSWNSYIWDLP